MKKPERSICGAEWSPVTLLSFFILHSSFFILPASPPPAAFSGGAGTVFNAGKDAYSLPLSNLTRSHRREFVVGNSFFKDNWVVAPATPENRDGLGPLFQARSCSACHVLDGRGAPPSGDEVMTGLLLRLSVPGKTDRCRIRFMVANSRCAPSRAANPKQMSG